MPHYKIRVLEVGYTERFPADFSFDGLFLAGETMFNPFSMTLLQGEGRNILVDCGIDMSNPAKRGMYAATGSVNGRSPEEVLGTVGLKPEDIHAVIMTHLHWDHASGVGCYPNAVYYLQRDELTSWEEYIDNPTYKAISLMSMDISDVVAFRGLYERNRLRLLDGETDNLFPGIHIRVSRFAHSFAQQMVYVDNDTGVYLIAGDVCNRPENLLGTPEMPFFLPNIKFSVGGAANALKDYTRIMQWVGNDVDRVVMSHDGVRKGRYPETVTELGLSVYEICE